MLLLQNDSQSGIASVMDSLVPEANAQGGGPRERTCLTITGSTTVRIEGRIRNASGAALVTAQTVTVAGAAVPMDIVECPDNASGIGQITVQVATLTSTSATGTYSIGGGRNTVPFTLVPGPCSAPTCPRIVI